MTTLVSKMRCLSVIRLASTFLVFTVLATGAGSSSATPITLQFSGIIQPGSSVFDGAIYTNWDKQTFSGRFTFDTVLDSGTSTDNVSDVISPAPWTSTSLYFPGGVTVSSDNYSTPQFAEYIYRNYSNPPNTNALQFVNQSTDLNGGAIKYSLFYWLAIDFQGLNSTLFSDPNGGLSFAQPFDLTGYEYDPSFGTGPRQFGDFNLIAVDDQRSLHYQYTGTFSLTSLGATPIPEPATLTLLAISLAGLGFITRRQA
jgi:hypothetical protein